MKNEKPIYTVTCLVNDHLMSGVECVGFFHELAPAKRSVMVNDGDLHENYYKYVVIEEKFPGLYCVNKNNKWFVWDNSKYISCECPESYKNIINFAM